MKIKDYKKKCVILSIYLIIIGTMISLVGFGINGFNMGKFKEKGIHKWYQTIQIDDNSYSYGIDFGKGMNILDIGN